MRKVLTWLGVFAQNRYVTLICGVIMVVCASFEIVEDFDMSRLGAHHGLAIMGVVQILKTIPEFVDGLIEMDKSGKEILK